MVPSHVFAGVGGYYASKQSGLAGVFRRDAADGSDWKHALSEIEAFTVFVHPRDPNLVFAGTADGVYRSTDRGQNFRRADFPDRGVQVWSFLQDDVNPKWMLAGCLSVAASSKDGALYRSQDVGKTWQRFDKVTPHGTLMSVGLHHGDARQVYVAARYGEVFGTQDGGESWLEMPLPEGVQHVYALACG